jgi:hypothetical protein
VFAKAWRAKVPIDHLIASLTEYIRSLRRHLFEPGACAVVMCEWDVGLRAVADGQGPGR